MPQDRWNDVDAYINGVFVPPDEALDRALKSTVDAGMPQINVAPNQGLLLQILARSIGAKKILEIGTLAGYSAIWMARALPPGGRLLTLEASARHAEVARANLARAGLSEAAEVRLGRALETLPRIAEAREGPFDLVFIDADKNNIPDYFAWSLKLTRRGSLIVVDNVIRGGAVADPKSQDPNVLGVRRFNEMAAKEPRVSATAIQTVGSKGWDGFAFVLVTADP